jgi:hypothetical protein
MAATSVTGTGIGESFGKQKPNNNASCGGGDTEEEAKKKVIKNGCYVSYKVRGHSSHKIGQSKSIRVC